MYGWGYKPPKSKQKSREVSLTDLNKGSTQNNGSRYPHSATNSDIGIYYSLLNIIFSHSKRRKQYKEIQSGDLNPCGMVKVQ